MPELEYFQRPERFPGFLERLTCTRDELLEECVTPDELAPALDASDAAAADGLRQRKLRDLQRIYAAYLDYLTSGRLDPSQVLDFAREQLPRGITASARPLLRRLSAN